MAIKKRGIRRPVHRGDNAFPLIVRLKGLEELRPDSRPMSSGSVAKRRISEVGTGVTEETTSDFAASNHTASLP